MGGIDGYTGCIDEYRCSDFGDRVVPAIAQASSGCTAVNNVALNGTTTGTINQVGFTEIPVSSFSAGDVIHVSQIYGAEAGSVPGNSASRLLDMNRNQVAMGTGTTNYNYIITGLNDLSLTFQRAAGNGGENVSTTTTATCQPVAVAPPAPPAASVPTLGEWGMIGFGVLVAGGGALAMQRRRVA